MLAGLRRRCRPWLYAVEVEVINWPSIGPLCSSASAMPYCPLRPNQDPAAP